MSVVDGNLRGTIRLSGYRSPETRRKDDDLCPLRAIVWQEHSLYLAETAVGDLHQRFSVFCSFMSIANVQEDGVRLRGKIIDGVVGEIRGKE